MRKLPNQFDYEYRCTESFGSWLHMWIVHGRHGSVHFHVNVNPERDEKYGGPTAGLETHYRVPPDHMKDHAPSRLRCSIMDAPCWHDGTSLYATESLLPRVRFDDPTDFFPVLIGEMRRFDEAHESDDPVAILRREASV